MDLTTCPSCGEAFLPLFPERSARGGQCWVSRSARLAVEQWPPWMTVADYGCGLLRNTQHLASHFRVVIGVDTRIQVDRVRNLAGTIPLFRIGAKNPPQCDGVCIFSVLHILPSDAERIAAVADALRFLKTGGEMMIDVPVSQSYYDGENAKKLTPHNDGFVLKSGTFYRNFRHSEVRNLIERAGLEILRWWPEPNNAIARCRKKRLQLGNGKLESKQKSE